MSHALQADRTPSPSGYLPGTGSMWFFILGDLFIFGIYFICFVIYRGQNEALFLQSQQHLNQDIGVLNTLVLLTSSLFVALGTEATRSGKTREGFKLLAIAFGLGVVFPLLKAIEWLPKLEAGMTPGENMFFLYYYLMTGLHLMHVVLGLVILAFVMHEVKVQPKPNIGFVETGAIYWHMVDLLWLLLFGLFYLLR